MRGCDGYDKVIQVVEALKDEVPLSLMFCLSPWNSFDDMAFVIDVAKHYGVDVRIGIYGTMAYMVASPPASRPRTEEWSPFQSGKSTAELSSPLSIKEEYFPENYDYIALYDQWRKGHLRLRCQSIMSCLVIHSNGDVPLCQNLDVVLGNIHRQSLDEIFNSSMSCQTQCQYSKNCNDCWINFHRKYDIILVRNMERLLPKRLIEQFYGQYQWTDDPRTTYHQLMEQL
jgi:MoaA/NifB/PqqE/SkfB family radical SAM enzyme